jgi:hypothetical protein
MDVMGDSNKNKLQMFIINDFAKYMGRVNADICCLSGSEGSVSCKHLYSDYLKNEQHEVQV